MRNALRAELERIKPELPAKTDIALAFDGTVYMENSIREIGFTFAETGGDRVGLIVFLFLGSAAVAPSCHSSPFRSRSFAAAGGDDADGASRSIF